MSFKKYIFRVSCMTERKGWTHSQNCRTLLDNGQPLSFCRVEVTGMSLYLQFLWKDPTARKYLIGSGWHFPMHLYLFLSSISHHYSNLQYFLLHCYYSIFFKSESVHYELNSAIFPQIHLEVIGSLTVRAMLFRK